MEEREDPPGGWEAFGLGFAITFLLALMLWGLASNLPEGTVVKAIELLKGAVRSPISWKEVWR